MPGTSGTHSVASEFPRSAGRSPAHDANLSSGHIRAVGRTFGEGARTAGPMRHRRIGPSNAIRDFFRQNPDEELTVGDIALKWGVTYNHATKLASRLRERGELESYRDGIRCVYTARDIAPKPDLSLPPKKVRFDAKVMAYFAENPGEELTIDEASEMFGVAYRIAGRRLRALYVAGKLTRRTEKQIATYGVKA